MTDFYNLYEQLHLAITNYQLAKLSDDLQNIAAMNERSEAALHAMQNARAALIEYIRNNESTIDKILLLRTVGII